MKKQNNAAIWYAADGYDPAAKGMNGRRVAGQSFLNGFFRHANVDKFTCVSTRKTEIDSFCELAKTSGRGLPADGLLHTNFNNIRDIGTVFYPGPTFARESWRRFHMGQATYSLCGIAHTTATNRAMQGIYSVRVAPIEPWDALICTSNSLRTSVEVQLDQIDAYLEARTGTPPPPRPMLPIIPLGIDADTFDLPEKLGVDLRKKLNIAPETRVAMVMCRLSALEKFDPLPMYQALSLAQKSYGGDMALILCGFFPADFEEIIFLKGAKALMPNVALHVVDGKDQEAKKAAFSAADIFLFPIDNIQETFGIAPLEGMAAGLPVIASDWDGMRDTVSEDVGFRIPSIMAGPHNSDIESFLHMVEIEGYMKYLGRISMKTVIDVPQMAEKIALLAGNPELARKMGSAGRARVRSTYDWSVIIPQMQELWAEQTQIRQKASKQANARYQGLMSPIAPPATRLFASYPTQSGLKKTNRVCLNPEMNIPQAVAKFEECIDLRIFPNLKSRAPKVEQIVRHLMAANGPVIIANLMRDLDTTEKEIEEIILMLLKYDVLRRG